MKQARTPFFVDLRSVQQPNVYQNFVNHVFSLIGVPPFPDLRSALQYVKSHPTTIESDSFCIAIDEFDLIKGADAHNILGFLSQHLPMMLDVMQKDRKSTQEHNPIEYRAIIGSRLSLFDIERAVECIDSPYYHQFHVFRLAPLTVQDAHVLVASPIHGQAVSLKSEAKWLIRYAGTWPVFLKLACHHALQTKIELEGMQLSKQQRLSVEQRVWEDGIEILNHLWVQLTSRQRDLLVNLDTWSLTGDSWRFDPDWTAILRDGLCRSFRGKISYACELFQHYFKDLQRQEPINGHSTPPGESILDLVATTLRRVGACTNSLSSWDDTEEKSIQDVVFMILRSQFDHTSREVHISKGPKREYRCDLLIEDYAVIVETKRIRSQSHANSVQAEIHDDIVGYRQSGKDYKLVFFIWDKNHFIADRVYFADKYQSENHFLRIVFAP